MNGDVLGAGLCFLLGVAFIVFRRQLARYNAWYYRMWGAGDRSDRYLRRDAAIYAIYGIFACAIALAMLIHGLA